MAKLSARGRTILITMIKEGPIQGNDLIDWQRRSVALASDGHILEKLDVQFKAGPITKGYKHSYGWKDMGKVRAEVSAESIRRTYSPDGYIEKR